MVELGLLGELKVATEGSSASPFIGRRSGNSSQLQPPPIMAATVAGRRLVGVAERSGGTEATARLARRGCSGAETGPAGALVAGGRLGFGTASSSAG